MNTAVHAKKRAEQTRVAIHEAARSCFGTHGYAGASMDLIAAEAGVTKPTVYAHFGDKAGLFEELIRHELASSNEHPIEPATTRAEMATALEHASREHLDWLLDEPRLGLLRAAAGETMRRPEWAQTLLAEQPSSLSIWLAQLTTAGLVDIADPEEAAQLHIATLKGALFYPALLGLIPIATPGERARVAHVTTAAFLEAHAAPRASP